MTWLLERAFYVRQVEQAAAAPKDGEAKRYKVMPQRKECRLCGKGLNRLAKGDMCARCRDRIKARERSKKARGIQ